MQIEFRFDGGRRVAQEELFLRIGAGAVPVRLVRHRRAKRYVLRLAPDGAARVTLPRGGSIAEAMRFARQHTGWLEKQLLRQAAHAAGPAKWQNGTTILFRGQHVPLELGPEGQSKTVRFAGEAVAVDDGATDLRPEVERHLRNLASRELPARVRELAALHQIRFSRVSVRNQRSRWGSRSRAGTISLNWRLIQAPPFVSDYIILHELAHVKEMNHSPRFWGEVARLCPEFPEAERWLKQNGNILRR